MPLFKELAAAIAWLTSSLAGLAAILYVSGYLITVAELHLLGLSGLVTYSSDRYLQEGGNFFLTAGAEILEIVLVLLVSLALVGGVLAGIAGGIFLLLTRRRPERRAEIVEALRARVRRHALLWQGVVYTALLALLARIAKDPQSFSHLFGVANLLFVDPASAAGRSAKLLLKGDQEQLAQIFSNCIYLELFAGALLIAVRALTRTWRLQFLALMPFVVIFLLYTMFLPILYGILRNPLAYPVVTLSLKEEAGFDPAETLYLLNPGEQELILYRAAARQVVALPRDQVKRIMIERVEPIFRR